MPLAAGVAFVLKELGNDRPDWASMTFGNNSPPKRAFCAARWLDRASSGDV